jgi:hypothetical protein
MRTETGLTIWDRTQPLHLVVDTLAGSATVSVHALLPGLRECALVGTVTVDPVQVLELARVLVDASVPAPPVVERRVLVRRSPVRESWVVMCPECFTVPGSWTDQPSALAAAWAHLEVEHAGEREGAA